MNYGQMIRVARKKLSLNQSDLANNKISRTLISEIEKGNTSLVTSKALLIYKKIIEESYLQKTDVVLDFDSVLKNNFEYIQLKQGEEILSILTKANKEEKNISTFELENYRVFALKSQIGMFKYYIFREIALNAKEDTHFKTKVLFNALDFLKWNDFEKVYRKYDETLKEVTSLAYKEGLIEELIHYYEYQKDGLIELKEFIEPRIYYNLALFNELLRNYEIAYRYLNTYLDHSSSLKPSDYYDALLGIPRLSTKAGNYEKGIKQYEELLSRIIGDEFLKQRSIIFSNILFNIPKLEKRFETHKIKTYLEELMNILPEVIDQRDFPSELMVNIAIGHALLENNSQANDFIKKAFEYTDTSELKANVIVDAFNNIEKIDIDFIVKKIKDISIDALPRKDKFMLVLLKLQKRLYKENKKKSIEILDDYIDEL